MQAEPRRSRATTLGFLSVLLWGTSIAVGRFAIGQVGFLRGPMIMSLASGVIGTAYVLSLRRERAELRTLPASYWVVCGGLFVLYAVAYNLGIGLATDGRQVLVFGMLNYLWPVLTVVFSTLIFKRRASFWLAPGILVAMAGIVLAFLSRPSRDPGLSVSAVLTDIAGNPVVYLLGLLCGVVWGLYSNLGRKMVGDHEANPVPVLFLATGAVFLILFLSGAFPQPNAGRSRSHELGRVGDHGVPRGLCRSPGVCALGRGDAPRRPDPGGRGIVSHTAPFHGVHHAHPWREARSAFLDGVPAPDRGGGNLTRFGARGRHGRSRGRAAGHGENEVKR